MAHSPLTLARWCAVPGLVTAMATVSLLSIAKPYAGDGLIPPSGVVRAAIGLSAFCAIGIVVSPILIISGSRLVHQHLRRNGWDRRAAATGTLLCLAAFGCLAACWNFPMIQQVLEYASRQ